MAAAAPDREDLLSLLVGRLRAGLWVTLLAMAAFALSDPVVHPEHLPRLSLVVGLELAVALAALGSLRLVTTTRQVIAVAFITVSAICVTTALSGIIVADASTTPVVVLVLTLGAATLLPWGVVPQLLLQVVATAAIIWNVHTVRGIEAAATLPVAVVVGGVVALYGASDAARYHHERRRAELAEAELRARKHQVEVTHAARLSTLGGMAAGLAHEINQPLSAIVSYARGCARRLRAGDTPPEALLDIVESIAAQALRAAAVLRRIRDFVRHQEVARERADLGDVVREALRFAEVEARQLGVALRVELSPAPLAVAVDPVQIEQVILNLVRNAFEAIGLRPDAESGEVVVRTAATARGAEVIVSDSGPGVSPEVAARLFEPFFTTKREGLGLGLSISRSIVDAHDGRLWVADDRPGGATFHVELPRPRGARGVAA